MVLVGWVLMRLILGDASGRGPTVPLTSYATLQKSGLWGSGISTFVPYKHCSEHRREEMSHWRHAEILDIGRDTGIRWGAQLIVINDCCTFKLDEI